MSKLVFITDDPQIRSSHEVFIQVVFNGLFEGAIEVIDVEVDASLEDLAQGINELNDVSSVFVTEQLTRSGLAAYSGLDLAKRIKQLDPTVPVYNVTSTLLLKQVH